MTTMIKKVNISGCLVLLQNDLSLIDVNDINPTIYASVINIKLNKSSDSEPPWRYTKFVPNSTSYISEKVSPHLKLYKYEYDTIRCIKKLPIKLEGANSLTYLLNNSTLDEGLIT
jgi:hypothetical protein